MAILDIAIAAKLLNGNKLTANSKYVRLSEQFSDNTGPLLIYPANCYAAFQRRNLSITLDIIHVNRTQRQFSNNN